MTHRRTACRVLLPRIRCAQSADSSAASTRRAPSHECPPPVAQSNSALSTTAIVPSCLNPAISHCTSGHWLPPARSQMQDCSTGCTEWQLRLWQAPGLPGSVAHPSRMFATAEICERRRRASKQAKDASIQSAVLHAQLLTVPERAKDPLHPGMAHAALCWTAEAWRCGFYTRSTFGPGMWN